MHNPGFFSENETHKILCDFEIQTDDVISAKRPGLSTYLTIRFSLILLCGLPEWEST